MKYIDGYIVPVKDNNKDAYLKAAEQFAVLAKEYGATRVVECWADDVPLGKVTDFARAVQLQDGEVAVFSWIEYPSKAVRNEATAKMHQDPRMKNIDMAFDGKRMIIGGFMPILDT